MNESILTDPRHPYGYREGDQVPVFFTNGVSVGTALRFTPSGRLVVEVKVRAETSRLQFNAQGRLVGNPGNWYYNNTRILPKAQAETAARGRLLEANINALAVQTRAELRRMTNFAVQTPVQRKFLADSLRQLAKRVEEMDQ